MSSIVRRIGAGLLVCICLLCVSVPRSTAGQYDVWEKKMPIRFSGYDSTAPVTGFPVLVILNTSISGFSYADVVSPVGGDLRFSDSTEELALSYEIEEWNTNGDSFVWVRVPSIAGTNDYVWAFWGHPAETNSPPHTPVWSEYRAVWHLDHTNGVEDLRDSSGNGWDGTDVGSTNELGKISYGQRTSTGKIQLGALPRPAQMTLSAWVKVPGGGGEQPIIHWPWHGGAGVFAAYGVWGDYINLRTWPGDPEGLSGSIVCCDDTWHHIAIAQEGDRASFYVDGRNDVLDGSVNEVYPSGVQGLGDTVNGVLDEVRLATTSFSSNRIWATWFNQASNSAFCVYGPAIDTPDIENGDAANVGFTSAGLNGILRSTGGQPTTAVKIFYGQTDGGTDIGSWSNVADFGELGIGLFSTNATGLVSNELYYSCSYSSNSAAEAWAPSNAVFITGEVTVDTSERSFAREEDVSATAVFTISRPLTCVDENLLVYYSLSGSADNGLDYEYLDGQVVIPAGLSTASVAVVPIDDDILFEGVETIDLTIEPGPYVSTGNTARARIRDDDIPHWWGYSCKITFPGYSPSSTLTNFPMLVALSTNIPGFAYEQFASPTGGDLRFIDEGKTKAINHEIDYWDTNGTSHVWVCLEELAGTETTIWAIWGNPKVTNHPASCFNGVVWNGDYEAVWHLDGGTNTAYDSTSNYNHSTAIANVSNAVAQIGPGREATGGGEPSIRVPLIVEEPASEITVSAWVNVSVGKVTYYYAPSGGTLKDFGVNGSGQIYASVYPPTDGLVGGMVGSGWHHLAITKDCGGGTAAVVLYLDGQSSASDTLAHPAAEISLELMRGATGTMDEVRISRTLRSEDWIWACWASQGGVPGFTVYEPATGDAFGGTTVIMK